MVKKIWKASEWQTGSGRWYVNCVDDLADISGLWWIPCRILNLSPEDFVLLLKDKFGADHFYYNKETNVLIYSWSKYQNAHKWLLYINAEARKKQFYIGM